MCSYTFRSFDRAHLIGFLKQLEISTINLKDAKDHLPSTSAAEEQKALDDYKAAAITPTAVGTVYFPKDEDADIRSKFEYAKLAGVKVIVAGDPLLQCFRASSVSSRSTTSRLQFTITGRRTRSGSRRSMS